MPGHAHKFPEMAMTPDPLTLISSMATRQVLSELLGLQAAAGGPAVRIESVGGVDAARRVRAGEVFDIVALASDAIDALIADGHLLPGSRTDLVRSGVAVAVQKGAPRPDVGSQAALRAAVMAAASIGYSTGPSGVQLKRLFERWGIADEIAPRLVQAPAGVPVGSMVADGTVALGFQQLSELLGLQGIEILGPLPEAVQIVTVFSAGLGLRSTRTEPARAVLQALTAPGAAEVIRRHGMEPA